MTREAEAAFKAWAEASSPEDWMANRIFAAGLAAADTDATRKLAQIVELVGVLKAEAAENDGKRGEPYRYMAEVARRAASRILAIVEE